MNTYVPAGLNSVKEAATKLLQGDVFYLDDSHSKCQVYFDKESGFVMRRVGISKSTEFSVAKADWLTVKDWLKVGSWYDDKEALKRGIICSVSNYSGFVPDRSSVRIIEGYRPDNVARFRDTGGAFWQYAEPIKQDDERIYHV